MGVCGACQWIGCMHAIHLHECNPHLDHLLTLLLRTSFPCVSKTGGADSRIQMRAEKMVFSPLPPPYMGHQNLNIEAKCGRVRMTGRRRHGYGGAEKKKGGEGTDSYQQMQSAMRVY